VPFPAINTSEPPEANRARSKQALETISTLLDRHHGEIAGIIVEPIQGAGGHRMAEPGFFQGLSRLAHDHGVCLGFDEVQTAGGPTGSMFMVDQLSLPFPPQAVATAKKFGAGVVYMLYPMEDKGVLDSTWGGALADMVRFVQEMRIVEREKLVEAAAENGLYLSAKLHEFQGNHPGEIQNIRGVGLYQGFSFLNPGRRNPFVDAALERESLLLLPAGRSSIRLRPNLSVTREDIDLLMRKLENCFSALDG
jgi:L-lysine 6-transaminase